MAAISTAPMAAISTATLLPGIQPLGVNVDNSLNIDLAAQGMSTICVCMIVANIECNCGFGSIILPLLFSLLEPFNYFLLYACK